MPVVKITGQGIAAIGLSVGLLWACWIATAVTMERSLNERARVFQQLERMQHKRQPEPVFLPRRPHKISSLITVG